MTAPTDSPLDPALRERLIMACEDADCGDRYCDGCRLCSVARVDAIVAELVRAGWRDLGAVRDADQATADHGRTG